METTQAQAEPTPAPPVPDLAHAPIPSVASSDVGSSSTTQLTPPAPTETAPAVDVAGMDEEAYIAARDAFLATPPPEPQGTPATDATPPATPTDAPAPANENPEPPADDAPPALDDTAAPERIRLGGLSEKSRALTAAAVLLAKAEGIEITDAFARMAKTDAPASTDTPAPAAPVPTEHPDAIAARIAQLEADYDAAAESADTVAMAKAHREMRHAERELHQSVSAYEAGVSGSMDKAVALYPDFKSPNSALAQKWDEIDSRLKANNDPLGADTNPNKPLILAQMAAAELGIAPKAPAAKVAPPLVAPKASPSVPATPQPAIRPVQPAPGSARSAAPSNQTGQLETELAGVTRLSDYESLLDKLGVVR